MLNLLITATLLLTPTYELRLNLFGIPTNLLMLWVVLFWIIFFTWIISKQQINNFIIFLKNTDKKILILSGLFFLSGLIGLFVRGIDRAKIGQFIVLFLQPMSLFFITRYIFVNSPKSKNFLLSTFYFLLAAAGVFAVVQYFTLLGLPSAFWGNSVEPKRAVAFFIHPNFYALWAAPLLALLIPDLMETVKSGKWKVKSLKLIAWVIGGLGLLLSLSRAGWVGLTTAVAVYFFVAADKKIKRAIFAAVMVMVVIILVTPSLRWRFALPLYGEKSAVSRFSLWTTGIKAVKQGPMFGIGLNGFSNNWQTLNTDAGLTDTHNFPHNIFLDFWVETGLLGLISFIAITALFIYKGLHHPDVILRSASDEESQTEILRSAQDDAIKLAVSLFLICLLVQGQIDNPYFKNDLALIFWMILALV